MFGAGTVGGSSDQVGAVRGIRVTAGRGIHLRNVSRDVLSSDDLCFRLGDGKRWPDARSARAGGARKMKGAKNTRA